VSLAGLLPTLAELCGVSLPAGPYGESFARDLREPAQTRDTIVYAEFNLNSPRPRYMIRQGAYKYCHYVGDPMAELFHLGEDPQEMHNLSRDPKYADEREKLKSRLFAWTKIG
jgi:choline-sulfatase